MGCGCRGGNRSGAKQAGGVPQVYQVTLPGETVAKEFLTPLEAKRAIRRAGGGTIKRVPATEPE